MMTPTRAALTADLGFFARHAVQARALRVSLALDRGPAARPAPPPQPRRLASDLDALLHDGRRLPDPSPARAALAAFTAGDGFLPGQIIDRAI